MRLYKDIFSKCKIYACGGISIILVTSHFAQKRHFFNQISKNCTAVSFYSNKLKLWNYTNKRLIFNGLKVYFDTMPITCSNSPSQSSQMSKKNEKSILLCRDLKKPYFCKKSLKLQNIYGNTRYIKISCKYNHF